MTGFYEGTGGGAAPVPHVLDQHTDVSINVPLDGEVLTYNTEQEQWINATGAGGGGGVEEAPIDGIRYVRKDAAWIQMPIAVSYIYPVTADFQMEVGNFYFVDTTAGLVTATWPLSPLPGQTVGIQRSRGSNPINWNLNGKPYENANPGSPTLPAGQSETSIWAVFMDDTIGWTTIMSSRPLEFLI